MNQPLDGKTMKTFAANLMLEGKRCLVVGGGKIASRKIKLLAESKAKIFVVAPEISQSAKDLCVESGAEMLIREFQDSDLEDTFLAFAATDSSSLNAKIVALCSERGLLCCAIDANWPNGSFITPASFESGGVKVAISTGGASCRKSKLLKESLSLHISSIENADLFVLGFDHKHLSLEQRASLHLEGDSLERAGRLLSRVWGLHEFMILNTCNRMEIIGAASPDHAAEELIKNILGIDALPQSSYYVKRGWEAFSHLPSVAAGVHSQTPGEKHIVAQLKDALKLARERSWAGPLIQEWVDAALHISKHIRADIEPLFQSGEIEDMAIRLAKERLGGLKDLNALVLGTGRLGSELAEKLIAAGVKVTCLYHSKKPAGLSASLAPLGAMKELLPNAKLVFAATSSPEPLVTPEHKAMIRDGSLLIDLCVPRNIDTKLDDNAKFETFDLDDIKFHFRRELAQLPSFFKICTETIGQHRELYGKTVAGLKGGDQVQPAGADSN